MVLRRAMRSAIWLLGLLLGGLLPATAHAELDLSVGGRLQSNVRYRPGELSIGESFYDRRSVDSGFSRNEHILKLKLNATTERFAGVVDVDIVWLGFARATDLGDLSLREVDEPVRIEAQSAYLEATDLFVEGLDLRVGYQIVNWGAADQFNPTNNLNADDLEDRLLFGAQQSNLMARLDYAPHENWTFSGALVPIFRPALVPNTAGLAVAAIDRLPHVDKDLRHLLQSEAAASRQFGFPTIVDETIVALPKPNAKNMQFMLRAATSVFEQDIALSYYFGRSDFPVASQNFTTQDMTMRCAPGDTTNCVDGVLLTDVTLSFPKVQVAGLNFAGEVDLLGWLSESIHAIGYRLELGVFFPREQRLAMLQDEIVIGPRTIEAGSYPGLSENPVVLPSTPFAKWTVGLDYTFNEHVYLNVMWVHGLADEFGAGDFISDGEVVRRGSVVNDEDTVLSCVLTDVSGEKCANETLRNRIGDYLVAGIDLRFMDGNLLFRLFTILELTGYAEERYIRSEDRRVRQTFGPFTPEGFSAVVFPELSYDFGEGLNLAVGALFELGKSYSKFGEAAAGGSVGWFRGRYSF